MIRLLSDTLAEVAEAMLPDAGGIVLVESAMLDLPLEIHLSKSQGAIELYGDVPRWRWTTDFDVRPGRIRVELHREMPQ